MIPMSTYVKYNLIVQMSLVPTDFVYVEVSYTHRIMVQDIVNSGSCREWFSSVVICR